MRQPKRGAFIFTAFFIICFATAAFFGVSYTSADGTELKLVKGAEDIKRGIDIMGGISVSFGASESDIANKQAIDSAKTIIQSRLIADDIIDYELYADGSAGRIILSFPSQENASSAAENLVNRLAKRALLVVVDGAPIDLAMKKYDESGKLTFIEDSAGNEFPVAFTGEVISNATTMSNPYQDRAIILTLNEEGRTLYAEATARNINGTLSFLLDSELIYALPIDHIITSGKAVIGRETGFTTERSQELCYYLNTGALPFELKALDYEVLKATLGDNALEAMLLGGVIALVAICLFMLIRYRLPGFVACLSLLGLVAVLFAAVSGFFPFIESFTLTLPGIAGMILAVGMGVDANIITSERIKEEILKGKNIDTSINLGMSNSLSSIFDSNVTLTFIAVILLGIFGPPGTVWSYFLYAFTWFLPDTTTGSIYSFGYTLLAGVAGNYIMGVFATRLMLASLSRFNLFNNKWFFGGERA